VNAWAAEEKRCREASAAHAVAAQVFMREVKLAKLDRKEEALDPEETK